MKAILTSKFWYQIYLHKLKIRCEWTTFGSYLYGNEIAYILTMFTPSVRLFFGRKFKFSDKMFTMFWRQKTQIMRVWSKKNATRAEYESLRIFLQTVKHFYWYVEKPALRLCKSPMRVKIQRQERSTFGNLFQFLQVSQTVNMTENKSGPLTTIVNKYPTFRDDAVNGCWKYMDGRRVDDNAEGFWRVHNKLYNLREFKKIHPGGEEWLAFTKARA